MQSYKVIQRRKLLFGSRSDFCLHGSINHTWRNAMDTDRMYFMRLLLRTNSSKAIQSQFRSTVSRPTFYVFVGCTRTDIENYSFRFNVLKKLNEHFKKMIGANVFTVKVEI